VLGCVLIVGSWRVCVCVLQHVEQVYVEFVWASFDMLQFRLWIRCPEHWCWSHLAEAEGILDAQIQCAVYAILLVNQGTSALNQPTNAYVFANLCPTLDEAYA